MVLYRTAQYYATIRKITKVGKKPQNRKAIFKIDITVLQHGVIEAGTDNTEVL
jgi:hypothetical protein